jgi:FdhD protein
MTQPGATRSGREPGLARRPVTRAPNAGAAVVDEVAVEEPLEIRVAGDALSITMRSPGADRELALGFLYAEGVIGSVDDVGTVAHCGHVGTEGFGNVIDVLPGPGVVLAPERVQGARRGTLTTSACGVCGRLSIDDLVLRCAPVRDESRVAAGELSRLCAGMRAHQRLFARTGGVHAASLHDLAGGPPILHEDVGRHNAVDKVVGSLILAGQLGRGRRAGGRVLIVSGRASFEILQKAAMAGIPIVASVSAASSLAIDLAARMNITLASFVRDGAMSVYSCPWRIGGLEAGAGDGRGVRDQGPAPGQGGETT